MKRPVTTEIDTGACIGCGSCVGVCPRKTLALVDGKAKVVGENSLQCGHCAAVCPQAAIRVAGLSPAALNLSTLVPAGQVAPAALAQLMRMRRSCRNYSDDPVASQVLDDLVTMGAWAPSGTNSQRWTFSLLPDRAAVLRLAEAVGDFFRLLEKLGSNRLVRVASKFVPGDPIGTYWIEHHESVAEALRDWEQRGRDRLFHGAQAAILIGMRPGASCPREDALLAAGQILLAAQSMGLGTVLVGFVVEALRRDPRIKRKMGLPKDEKIYAVIGLGHPAVDYPRAAGRFALVKRTL